LKGASVAKTRNTKPRPKLNVPKLNVVAQNELVKTFRQMKRASLRQFKSFARLHHVPKETLQRLTKLKNRLVHRKEALRKYMRLRHQLLKQIHKSLVQQIKALSAKGMVVNRNRSREGVLTVNTPNVNYGDAVCNCAKKLQSFDALGCKAELSSDAKGETGVERCVDLVNELNRKSPSCVCPIDPNSYGTCGVPLNFDLYGNGKVNGLALPLPALPASHAGRRLLQHTDGDKVTVTGLDDHPDTFASWVRNTAGKVRVEEGTLVWEDTIPEKHGEYIRENCADMKWAVGHDELGVSVKFDGLTFEVKNAGDRQRRRLLSRGGHGGC
jgi:hypothetical protein